MNPGATSLLIKRLFVASLLTVAVSATVWVIATRPSGATVVHAESPGQPFHDGPDKALWFNRQMIVDRNEGRIPYERLSDAKRFEIQARTLASRDLNWVNWGTVTPGRGRMLHYNPSTGVLFTGSVTGGLWRNNDYKAGAAWSYVDAFEGLAVSCMGADPNNPDKLYIGTGESFTAFVNYRESTGIGKGIFRSNDGGATWSLIPSTQDFFFINDLIVRNESGASVIYAAVGSGEYKGREFVQEGLYRSRDDGSTWDQVLPNIPASAQLYQVADLELTGSNRIYAGTMRNSNDIGGGVVLYSDDGDNWSVYADFPDNAPLGSFPGRVVVKAAPSNLQHLYALFTLGYNNTLGQLRDYEVYMRQSMDGGETWSSVELPFDWANIPWHALSMAVDPQNENKIVIGALDLFVLNDASNPAVTNLDWIRVSDWSARSYQIEPDVPQQFKDSLMFHYVHADIHDIQFVAGGSEDILVTTDGGLFYSESMGLTNNGVNIENRLPEYPEMIAIDNGLNTTQFYYARLHPQKGKMEAIGGAQDNGSVINNSVTDQMISGGDGGYAFWDSDNPELNITTVYGNRYFVNLGSEQFFTGPINGLFVNPMDYDDKANLLYSNMATSPNGGLVPGLKGRYYDSLEIFNLNAFVGNADMTLQNMPLFSFVKLNTGIKEAITAIKLSKHSTSLNKTAFIGTENGKIYKVTGLPLAPVAVRIDNDQLPIGYVSSVDIGENETKILATISNFGIKSVWVSLNSGDVWLDVERDLPDIPVRWGLFNPFDSNKILIATELGVWGLENIADENELWTSYNSGFPQCRVDMIDIRASDSTILAATHGYGLWTGKLNQGEIVTSVAVERSDLNVKLYPNPTSDVIRIDSDIEIVCATITDIQGRQRKVQVSDQQLSLANMEDGLYIVECFDSRSKSIAKRKVLLRR